MKSLKFWTRFALVPVLALACSIAVAQDAPDPVGNWDVVVDMGGTPLNATLVVHKNDDASYGGNLKSPMGELALEKVEYTGGEKITFGATIGEGDAAIAFTFDGKFTGPDTFEGTLVSETMGTLPVKGTRAVAGGGSPLSGVWDLVSESQLGTLERKLIVYNDGTGKYVTDADNAISELKVDGANVTFNVTVDAQGQQLPLAFTGTLAGDALNGTFGVDGQEMAKVTGTKSKTDIVAAAVGKWTFAAETPAGPYNGDLIIDAAKTGKLISEEGEAELKNLGPNGDKLTYDMSVMYQGQPYDVTFLGVVNGDTMTGDLLMAGSPVATVECKKAAN